MTEEYELPVPDDYAWLNLTYQEIVELRNKKHTLTDYGREKLRKMMTEFQPTPQTPEQVADGLRNAMKQAKKDGVFDNPTYDYSYPDEMLDVVEQQIQKRKSKSIRDIIERWWMDTFTSKNKWSVDTAIDDLADQIELWIMRNKEN